ncbi:MAG: NAD(P)/FAD-dependent oxidoreductase, partial [Promethearchaeota archaeon]
MDEFKCEVLVIGCGPAGLTAGIYCARANRDVIILDGKELPALIRTKDIQNWPGEIDIKGKHLLKKFRSHAESYSENLRIIKGDAISLMLGMGVNKISTRTANITSDVVIIATGGGTRKEIIQGEENLLGFGVSYSALWDGPQYKDKVVYLYGKDEEMLEDALTLQQMGCIVRIITNVGIEKLPEKIYQVKDTGIEIF